MMTAMKPCQTDMRVKLPSVNANANATKKNPMKPSHVINDAPRMW